MAASKQVPREQAIAIATKDAGGFLGTWVNAALSQDRWLIHAASKSVKPPVLYVIDSVSGKVLYKSLNSDMPATVTGKALDAQGKAAVVTTGGLMVYVGSLDRWPEAYLKKQVTVIGTLRSKEIDGGDQLVLEEATWTLSK